MPSIHFCRHLSDNEAANAHERAIAHEKELVTIDKFMRMLDNVPLANIMDAFERLWNKERPFHDVHWRDFRGAFGETVLHLVCIRRTTVTDDHQKVLSAILRQLITRELSMLGLGYGLEPYIGESLLHMVVANSDIETTVLVLEQIANLPNGKELLNARASGSFFKHLVSCPMEPSEIADQFLTPLSVAMLAPQSDDVALIMVEMLVKAGASTEYRDEQNRICGTAMHHLAKCRWNHGVDFQGREGAGGFITVERLDRLYQLFTSGEKFPPVNLRTKDCHNNTAFQLAAIIGNGEFLRLVIRERTVCMWQWGQIVDMRFPLDEIDSGGPANQEASVIELLALHKHKNTLSFGIFVRILECKWMAYGHAILVARVCLMTTITVLLTIAAAFTNSISSEIRNIANWIALCISSVMLIYMVVMFAIRHKRAWFWRLRWSPFHETRFHMSIWSLSFTYDILVLLLSVVVCNLHIWEEHLLAANHVGLVSIIDEFASVLVFFAWFRIMKFLTLFQTTGTMVGALPAIFLKDVLPFVLVLLVFMLGTAAAIKVATHHTIARNDEILGTFVSTFASLEESIHGADVNWRSTIEGKPWIAAVIFLSFLWMATIVLFNILIAMFSSRYFEYKKAHAQLYTVRWCTEMISQEKFMPVWLWDRLNLQIGTQMHTHSARSYGTLQGASARGGSDVEHGHGHIPNEQSGLYINTPRGQMTRWLSMEQSVNNENWGTQVDHWKFGDKSA